jgi:hypothetical protein
MRPETCVAVMPANAILGAHYLHRYPKIESNAIRKLEAFTPETAIETPPSVPSKRTTKTQSNQLAGVRGRF